MNSIVSLNFSKVYLVHMPQWNVSQPPMGISYIGAYLRSKGREVLLSDFSIELFDILEEDEKYLMDSGPFHVNWIHEETYRKLIYPKISGFIDACADKILESGAGIVGLTVLSTSLLPTLDLIKILKNKNNEIRIIIGGPYVTRYEGAPFMVKQKDVDFVVPDEGEETADELVSAIISGREDFENIKGIMFLKNDQVIDTGNRTLIEDINSIPYPAYESFQLEKYKDMFIPLLGSRGCIFNCTFCSETVLWKRYRYRSAKNIVQEMMYHLKNFETNYFYIVDSLINGNMDELIKMCKIIIFERLNVKWGGKVAVRTQMTRKVLDLMAKAGCTNLQYGIESGSPKVVRDMRKGFTIPLAKRVLKDTHEAGIKVGCFFLIGFPTETEADYQLTKKFLSETQEYIYEVIPGVGMGLQPGSEVHDHPERFNIKFDQNGEWYTSDIDGYILKDRVNDFREFCETLDVRIS